MADNEQIIFVDEQGKPTGETGPKLASHTANTKLHLAFSCYVFNKQGELLVTQRALSKKVWPGVWTNSFCGHPQPGESLLNALKRRGEEELGMKLDDIKCVLPHYRYKSPPYNGIVENEFCPVFIARAKTLPKPNPDEVEDYDWLTWQEFRNQLTKNLDDWSYWTGDQFKLLNHDHSVLHYARLL